MKDECLICDKSLDGLKYPEERVGDKCAKCYFDTWEDCPHDKRTGREYE